jgi:hypothetical protein
MEQKDRSLVELERQFQFAKSKEESDRTMAKIIKLLPNDFDLGTYIRNLYLTKIS